MIINFDEARARLSVEHSIEIDARAIPEYTEIKPSATFIERLRLLTDEQLAEIISVTLQELVE